MPTETTQQKIESLENALASGVYEATIGEQTVKYHSKAELLKALSYFKSMLAAELSDGTHGIGHRTRAIAGDRYI